MLSKLLNPVLIGLMITGCGEKTNVLGLTTPATHKESYFFLIDEARAAYNRNDLSKAYDLARKAIDLDPIAEDGVILFGFISLSLAGGDPFSLAGAIISQEEEKKKSQTAAIDLQDPPTGGTTAAPDDGTSDTLASLKAAIGLTPEDLALMGTVESSDPELPVLIPKCVEEVRHSVEKLQLIDDALLLVCPFVDPDARIAGDFRQNCESTELSRKYPAKAHFLWAFLHLTEALAFNAVLTYATSDPTGKKTNLELRVEKIKSIDTSTPEGINRMIEVMEGMDGTLNAILPTGGKCSEIHPTTQLVATLNDMLAVDAAFVRMPGIPPKITRSLKKSVAKLKQAGAGAQALRGDFTKKLSRGLSEKLASLGAAGDVPEDQKELLCGAFGSITQGSGQSADLCAE